MQLDKLDWNENNYNEYVYYLKSLGNIKLKEFNEKIINTKLEIIGISTPIMNKIAKEISKTKIEIYLEFKNFKYYEELMIYGLVLSKNNEKFIDQHLINFISYIDNWAICDSFCSNMKIVKRKKGKYWMFFTNLIDLNKEYQTRVCIVMLLNYYLCDEYIDRVLKIVCNIKTDFYYINMAISWLLSIAFIKYQDKVLDILKSKQLDKFVQNKTISKIRDSNRVEKKLKEIVKLYTLK